MDQILIVERMPVPQRGGDVFTGARMVFRATPGMTAESLQQLVDCQLSSGSTGRSQQQYPVASYCPLAIAGVTAQVRAAKNGFAVEVKPNDQLASRRIAHTVLHRSLALALESFESSECRGIAPKERAACPLLGPVTAVNDIPQGVRVDFAESVSVDGVLANMRCHYSFAQAHQFSEEATACPLYVRGLRMQHSTTDRAIDLTAADPATVTAVRKAVQEEAVFASNARDRR